VLYSQSEPGSAAKMLFGNTSLKQNQMNSLDELLRGMTFAFFRAATHKVLTVASER